ICTRLRSALEQGLGQMNAGVQVLGPAPAVITRVNNRYRYRLTLTGKSTPQVRHLISRLLIAVHNDKQARGVSVFADTNPLD
ncbi:MAG: hypothetical protein J6R39_00350, partial [Oscillospiraceae bacterium]|nr:hypothetical protein [Oscillospiraceae bacterium]